MNTYIFKNSTINNIDTSPEFISKIQNDNSIIDTLSLDTDKFILAGEFQTLITIENNCHLNLDKDFNLTNSSIILNNDTNQKKEIIITGDLKTFTSDLNINSDNNISLNLGLISASNSANKIILNLNPTFNSTDFFELSTFSNITKELLPIDFKISNTQNLNINSNLNTFDLGTSSNVNLKLAINSIVSKFINITDSTFNSVIASEDAIKNIETSFNIKVPLKALLVKVKTINGKGEFSASLDINIPNIPSGTITLSNNQYTI